jgi:hypothetical protein
VWEGERRGEDRGHKKRRERKEKEKEKTLREREREKERKRERDQWRVWQGGGDSQWDPICGVSMCGKWCHVTSNDAIWGWMAQSKPKLSLSLCLSLSLSHTPSLGASCRVFESSGTNPNRAATLEMGLFLHGERRVSSRRAGGERKRQRLQRKGEGGERGRGRGRERERGRKKPFDVFDLEEVRDSPAEE